MYFTVVQNATFQFFLLKLEYLNKKLKFRTLFKKIKNNIYNYFLKYILKYR